MFIFSVINLQIGEWYFYFLVEGNVGVNILVFVFFMFEWVGYFLWLFQNMFVVFSNDIFVFKLYNFFLGLVIDVLVLIVLC